MGEQGAPGKTQTEEGSTQNVEKRTLGRNTGTLLREYAGR